MQNHVVAITIVILAVGFYALVVRDVFDPASIRSKRVLITGASTGIGEQLAYQYSKLGAKLFLTARREKLLQEIATKCLQLGATEVIITAADMADASQRETVITNALQRLNGLDYLILNHVISYPGFWIGNDENLNEIQHLMQVNFISYVHLASKLMNTLNDNHGSIGVVSSVAGNVVMPKYSSYSASKFALQGFFNAVKQELIYQQKNVSITICVLGLIDTVNAIESTKIHTPHIDLSTAAPAAETALAIVKAVTTKVDTMYYPLLAYFGVMAYKFFPTAVEYYIRSLF